MCRVRRHDSSWIAGPSGSGKTTAAIAAAKALDLPFYSTLLRQAYEHGGVFLLDECDACDPGAMLARVHVLGITATNDAPD